MTLSRTWLKRALWVILGIVAVDQITKVIVLNTMSRGDSILLLGNFLKLTFTENPGMAFGLRVGPPWLVTIFSILATGLIVLYLLRVGKVYRPYQVSLSLVLGGALGNIIDRVIYGVIRGTSPLFQGHVVDFIHVNVWEGRIAESIPFIGGNYMAFFPIWNVADMAIVIGVVGIVFFQKKFHHRMEELELEKGGSVGKSAFEEPGVLVEKPVTPDPELVKLAQAPSPGNTQSQGNHPR